MAAIKKSSSVLKNLVGRLSTECPFAENTQKKVASWIDAASGALALIAGNTKVRDSIVTELLQKDPKHSLLPAVKAARAKVSKAEHDLTTLDESVGLANLDPDSPVTALFELKIPPAVSAELKCQPFDDVIGTICAASKLQMNEIVQQSIGLCKGYENQGDNCWKANIEAGTSFEDICQVAAKTIFLLSGRELKPLADQFEEATLAVKEAGDFVALFADEIATDGAHDAMSDLQTFLQASLTMKNVKSLIMEVSLMKAIQKYRSFESGSDQRDRPLGVVRKEISVLTSSSSWHLESDMIQPEVLAAAHQVLETTK